MVNTKKKRRRKKKKRKGIDVEKFGRGKKGEKKEKE